MFIKENPKVEFERETITLKDDGEIALDWLQPDDNDEKKLIVLILPGLVGRLSFLSSL